MANTSFLPGKRTTRQIWDSQGQSVAQEIIAQVRIAKGTARYALARAVIAGKNKHIAFRVSRKV